MQTKIYSPSSISTSNHDIVRTGSNEPLFAVTCVLRVLIYESGWLQADAQGIAAWAGLQLW